jgi:mycofactocin precursor
MAEQAAQVAGPSVDSGTETDELTSDELLVEEVSIDGMCGVY